MRERVVVGDDVVIGRGSLVENDTTIGAMTKIQAEAYITAYSTLEKPPFPATSIAPAHIVCQPEYDRSTGVPVGLPAPQSATPDPESLHDTSEVSGSVGS